MCDNLYSKHCDNKTDDHNVNDCNIDYVFDVTPSVPRGKRSDITENDRISFVSSYGDLLKLLDAMDNKENISDDMIETMINK